MASVFLTQSESKTLAVGLYGLVAGERNANFGDVRRRARCSRRSRRWSCSTGLQSYIVGGLTSGAVKG